MAVMKQLVKAGAEEVLKRLPFDQADTIVKSFGFKPGSSQDIFVREGGIHPTWGPGILNSIQKGEAQDLGRHITNATYNDQGALNEVARFGDNGVNQLNEDTIKANNLQQASGEAAPKQEDSLLFGPWPLKKSGEGVFDPEIDDSLSRSLLNANDQKDLVRDLKTPLYSQLAEYNIEITPEEMVSSGIFDTMLKRQGLAEEQAIVTKDYRAEKDLLKSKKLAKGDRSLKRAIKNFKTNNRLLNDLVSANIFTTTRDVFSINRARLKKELPVFGMGEKEWHHTHFFNRQGGKAFLNKIAQDPMIAANLFLKLKKLDIQTSGTVKNLSLGDKIPHNEFHKMLRKEGFEAWYDPQTEMFKGGEADISELLEAIAESVGKGETSINEMFDILDVFAERMVPFLDKKTKEMVGPKFQDVPGFSKTTKDYVSQTDKKFRTNVQPETEN